MSDRLCQRNCIEVLLWLEQNERVKEQQSAADSEGNMQPEHANVPDSSATRNEIVSEGPLTDCSIDGLWQQKTSKCCSRPRVQVALNTSEVTLHERQTDHT